MHCTECDRKAVYVNPTLCKEHFLSHFENTVAETINKFTLLKKSHRVVVAVSGGKDSLTLLHILKRLGYNVTALAIDEGIAGYREEKLSAMISLCNTHFMAYKIVSFSEEFRLPLDAMVRKAKLLPCTVCGVMRRYLLNKHAAGYDAIATGHNLDDESQAVMMNLLKNSTDLLARQGPVSGTRENKLFVRKVKPLYMCPEKEVMAYSFLAQIKTPFVECPYVQSSMRAHVRDYLNRYEVIHPGTKRNILLSYLSMEKSLKKNCKGSSGVCKNCSSPSAQDLCRTCRLVLEMNTFL